MAGLFDSNSKGEFAWESNTSCKSRGDQNGFCRTLATLPSYLGQNEDRSKILPLPINMGEIQK